MIFKSKKDWWLTIIVWGAMLFAIGSGGFALLEDSTHLVGNIIISLLSIILPIFLLWMWLTTYYVIDEENITVRFGPFKKMIPLNTIKSAKKTMNPLSSPALSLKRIEIVYGQYNMVLISPENREEFLDTLSKYCPNVKIIK